jgi:hypothetical protein
MNGLMHPEDMIEYALKHHEEILRLVEMEATLRPGSANRSGYWKRLLSSMRALLIKIRSQARPKDLEFDNPSICDESCVCLL